MVTVKITNPKTKLSKELYFDGDIEWGVFIHTCEYYAEAGYTVEFTRD